MPKKSGLHSPIRRCAACRRTAPKRNLLRFVRDPYTRQVAFDPQQRLPGRGAYLCPSAECFQIARKRKSVQRVLNAPVGEAVLQAAQAYLRHEQAAS